MTASSIVGLFANFTQSGKQIPDNADLLALVKQCFGTVSGITATPAGTQLNSLLMQGAINQITVSGAGNADSVLLPFALPGAMVEIVNDSANTILVFDQAANPANGNAGDVIVPYNSAAANATGTSIAVATAKVAYFMCTVLGRWKQCFLA